MDIQINVNYKDSGVKTLHAFAGISFIAAIFFAAGGAFASGSNLDVSAIVGMIVSAFFMAILGAVCLGVSTIAKTALLKRAILENEHQFIEVKDKK